MVWMILNPRELDAVRDAAIRAKDKVGTGDVQTDTVWTFGQPPTLKRDELEIPDAVMSLVKEWQRDWKSPYHAAFSAIVAANLRHN